MQVIDSFLLAAGVLFVIIGLRTKFDKSFAYFGFSLAFLALLTSIDLWLSPHAGSPETVLYLERLFHVLVCGYMIMTSYYFAELAHVNHIRFLRINTFITVFCSVLFLTHMPISRIWRQKEFQELFQI